MERVGGNLDPYSDPLTLLKESGAQVSCCDPFFPATHKTRKHDLGLRSEPCTAGSFSQFDAVVVRAAHELFAKAELFRGAKVVVDARNLIGPLFPQGRGPRVVKA